MTLGNLIREFRELNDMTMEEFAKRAGLSKSYISMLERNIDYRGSSIKPTIETIDKVANAIGVDIDTIISKIDQDVMINTSPKQALTEFIDDSEEASAKWKFIRYCFEHASKEDKERVLSILRVREKWQEFKEMERLFT